MTEFEDPIKEVCWQTYWEGYKDGRGTESYAPIVRQTALTKFRRWWSINVE